MSDMWQAKTLDQFFTKPLAFLAAGQAKLVADGLKVASAITTVSSSALALIAGAIEAPIGLIESAKSTGLYFIDLPPEKLADGQRPRSWSERLQSASSQASNAAYPQGFPPESGVCAAVALIVSVTDPAQIEQQYQLLKSMLTDDLSDVKKIGKKWYDKISKPVENNANQWANVQKRMDEFAKKPPVALGLVQGEWSAITAYDLLQGPIDTIIATAQNALAEIKSLQSDINSLSKAQSDIASTSAAVSQMVTAIGTTGVYYTALSPVDENGNAIQGGYLSRLQAANDAPLSDGKSYQAGVVMLLVAPVTPGMAHDKLNSMATTLKSQMDGVLTMIGLPTT